MVVSCHHALPRAGVFLKDVVGGACHFECAQVR